MKKRNVLILLAVALALSFLQTPEAYAQTSPLILVQQDCTALQGGIVLPKTDPNFPTNLAPSGAEYACSTSNGQVYSYYDGSGKGINVASTLNPTTGNFQNTQVAPASNCSVISPGQWFEGCIWEPLMSALGSLFLTIGGGLLRLAGSLFDLLVWKVVIGFGNALNIGANGATILSAIGTGWTILRDIANIAIIGIFIFIAIGIILGLKTYGQKKLVANVIIIAVLLNFSLLFTKMMIDFSNFTAYQFYTAMATTDPQDTTTDANGVKQLDTASAFMKPLGITNIWNTADLTSKIASDLNSGWAAFFYGLVGGLLLVLLAAILAYGSFLIILRGILFIVLMVTAAGAFATYLVPTFAEGAYGFKTWWKALLNASIFAPLLMIFLFISLQIAKAGAILTNANLNTFLSDPTTVTAGASAAVNASVWPSIFEFILVAGLLYASFKISSKIASSIPGSDLPLKFGRMAVSTATGVVGGVPGLAVGSLLGRRGYRRADELQAKSQTATRESGLAFNEAQAQRAQATEHARMAKLARETRQGEHIAQWREQQQQIALKEAERQMAISEAKEREAARFSRQSARAASRAPVQRFSKRVAERAKAAAAVAKRAEPTQAQIQVVRKQAEESYKAGTDLPRAQNEAAEARRLADTAKETNAAAQRRSETAETQRALAEEERADKIIAATSGMAGYKTQHGELNATRDAIAPIAEAFKSSFMEQLKNVAPEFAAGLRNTVQTADMTDPQGREGIRMEFMKAASSPAQQQEIQTELQKAETEHATNMREQNERIKSAREAIVRSAAGDDAVKTLPEIQTATMALNNLTLAKEAAQKNATLAESEATKLETDASAKERIARDLERVVNREARKAGEEAVANVRGAAEAVARRIAERGVDFFPNIVPDTETGRAAERLIQSARSGNQRMRDIVKGVMEAEKEETSSAPAKTSSS